MSTRKAGADEAVRVNLNLTEPMNTTTYNHGNKLGFSNIWSPDGDRTWSWSNQNGEGCGEYSFDAAVAAAEAALILYPVGSRVLVDEDGHTYAGNVLSVDGNLREIRFYDGDQGWASVADCQLVD